MNRSLVAGTYPLPLLGPPEPTVAVCHAFAALPTLAGHPGTAGAAKACHPRTAATYPLPLLGPLAAVFAAALHSRIFPARELGSSPQPGPSSSSSMSPRAATALRPVASIPVSRCCPPARTRWTQQR